VCDREVEWGEVVRGYQHAKGRYVVLTDEDFDKLPLPTKDTISLASFVKHEEIDPVYYDKTYYLEPDRAGLKAYALLAKALEQKGLSGVAEVAFRNRERLCALRPSDGTLLLETLHYPDEIREENRPRLPDVVVTDKELAMAESLIELLEEPFEPEKFHDDYHAALEDMVAAKLDGEEDVDAPPAPPAKMTDLVAALKARVEAAGNTTRTKPRSSRARTASAGDASASPGSRSSKGKRQDRASRSDTTGTSSRPRSAKKAA
jgi:DNA end-binding protein Ku